MALFEETRFSSLHLLWVNLCFRGRSTYGDSSRTTHIEPPVSWVVKGDGFVKNWNKLEGLENKGRILTRWAPQVEILNHPSVGGFVTHCGWNSTLEAMTASMPVAGWLQRAEQFLNKRLLVGVMGVGVSVLGEREARRKAREKGMVERERVREVTCKLTGGGEKAVERKNWAAEYGKMARETVKE